jgi:outer membrane receptor protein involved in Fe transport
MKLNANADTKSRLASLSLSMTFIMMLWPGALLLAQEDDSDDQLMLEEVIVTATRRGELLQDIPISVSAITKQKIEMEGIRTFEDYGVRVPNLSFSASSNSNATNSLNISIRGVAGGTTTGFYIDDTPLPQGLNPRVLDIERIEVLRGPQGTLFGARSMAGYLICRSRLKTSGGWVRSPLATMRTSGISYRHRHGLTAIQPIPRMLPWLTLQAS